VNDGELSRWTKLLDALDACWVDPTRAEPDDVLRMMEERQTLLDTLQTFDASTLEEPIRASLRARLAALVERDRELHRSVERWRDELDEHASRVREGRVVAAGYTQAPTADTTRLLRRA
jgi:hypothetical protein